MVLKIFSSDSIGTGVRSELASLDVLFVDKDAMVSRTDGNVVDDAAIRGLSGSNALDIRGSVVALAAGILLGDDGAADSNNTVTIAETGFVKSFYDAGIRMNAYYSDITNAGHIEGSHGIDFFGQQQGLSSSTLTNSGSIFGTNVGISRTVGTTETLSVVNTGTITGGAYAYFSYQGATAIDYVINKGTISGDVELGGGADQFDGRLGTIDGYVNGGSGSDTILGGVGADVLNGDNDADYLDGGAGDDTLTGGGGNDVLFGGAGDDALNGNSGADEHHGGAGNDTYLVGQDGDVIIELKGEGIDTVNALTDYTLSANVENLTLASFYSTKGTGNELANIMLGNGGQNVLMGMAGNDLLDGGEGMDVLAGGAGNDTYIVDNPSDLVGEEAGQGTDVVKASVSYSLADNVEKLILTGTSDIDGTGSADANTLTGNAGKNTLQGLDGNDILDGKAGIDTLVGGKGNDTYIVGDSGDIITELSGEGTDMVKASKSYTLSANVEKLILTGTANLNGTGSADANTLTGNTGANTLKGMDGNDTLDGGAGADRMEGGKGNDMFVVDNAGDKVVELSGTGTGTDTVKASISHTLAANVEKLILTGTGNLNGTGNELGNTLTGNAGANILKGLAGNDTLDGGAGADRMEGGLGNDTFIVDNAGDKVVELSGTGTGTDTVKTSISHTLVANVEKLVLTGAAKLNGTGNELANTLTGNTGANILKGLDGNDVLDGGAGADRLEGGKGNDTFVVDNAGDKVIELSGEGNDTVKASISHVLAANVEKLALTGAGAIDGTGNELANTLTGNAAHNVLKGMAGNDVLNGGGGLDHLFGGAGKDMFVFASAADSTMAAQDKIFDFSQAEGDRIDLRGVDASSLATDDQAFSFIAGSAFHKTAGELRFEVKAGDTIVQGDVNGDGTADFSFVLDTVVNLKASDFLF